MSILRNGRDALSNLRVKGHSWVLSDAGHGEVWTETLYHRDDALLYIAYVMLIWAAHIPADRWQCSLWP